MHTKTFIISDTHFNHSKIIEHANRREGWLEILMARWKEDVGDRDLVIHLGDVIFSKQSEIATINSSLPGTKVLVRGNHDKNNATWYLNHGFSFVCDSFVLDNILFSHEPKPIEDYTYNIHGHLHRAGEHRTEQYKDIITDRHILFPVEELLAPYPLYMLIIEHEEL